MKSLAQGGKPEDPEKTIKSMERLNPKPLLGKGISCHIPHHYIWFFFLCKSQQLSFLSNRYEKENAVRKKVDKELNDLRKQFADKENQLSKVNTEAKNLEQVMRELQSECQELKDALESAKYALEQETLTRVDLENKLQSLKEELSFKRSVYDKVGLTPQNIPHDFCFLNNNTTATFLFF